MAHHYCKPGPGKFEGENPLTALAYYYAGQGDDDVGRYSFFKAPFDFTNDPEALAFAHDTGFCDACIKSHLDGCRDIYGIVTWETDTGFAMLAELETEADYRAALADAEAEESEEY